MRGLLSPAETLPSLLGDVLSANKEKRFVQRLLSPESGNSIPTQGGLLQTHLMRAEMDEDGRAWAFPMVIQLNNGEMVRYDDPWMALENAKRTGNAIPFDSIMEADQWSREYKTPEFLNYWGRQPRPR